ncbi:MAG: hypothetical protein JJU08_18455 [Rhodobacteraceae bacterium]|nr:hypothetical protein [Paracoccaceae bacterium]
MPTGWEISFAGGAAGTAEIIGIGGEYIDLRVVQTGSTGAPLLRPVTVGASIPTSQGDDWAFSISLAMIAGDLAGNGTPQLRGTERTDAGGFLASPSFLQPVPITSTLTRFGGTASIAHADTKKITPDFRVQSTGAWDATFRISLPQLERGTVATNTQIARKGGFDVTEAGQQSVHYLQPDGVDDWLSFSDVTQEYTYTLAAAHDLHDSATFDSSAGTIFGNAGTGNNRFFRGARNRINIFRQADNHRSVATQNLSGRVVDIARLSAEGSAGDYWRNDVKAATLAVDEGTVAPLTFNTLFRSGSSYATGRFYGAGLINHAVSVHDRIRLQQYLSDLAGVSP